MMTSTKRPTPGTAAYWQDRHKAFALIETLEKTIRKRNRAPMYLAGPGYGTGEDSDDVIENLGPWEQVAALQEQARENPTVVEILTAQGRQALLTA